MAASVEVLVGCLRCGPEYNHFGDPFTFSATVLFREQTAEIIGGSGELYPNVLDDIKNVLKQYYGIKTLVWDRHKQGFDKRIKTST